MPPAPHGTGQFARGHRDRTAAAHRDAAGHVRERRRLERVRAGRERQRRRGHHGIARPRDVHRLLATPRGEARGVAAVPERQAVAPTRDDEVPHAHRAAQFARRAFEIALVVDRAAGAAAASPSFGVASETPR